MKIATSYFYQIRFFKPNMIPVSTAMWDPKWFHNFKNQYCVFKDRNGVYNGLRYPTLSPGDECEGLCTGQPCDKFYGNCPFLKKYEEHLDKIDFNKMIKDFEDICAQVRSKSNIPMEEEMIVVLMVHEKPDNPCSEREALIHYFNKNGIKCNELEYPIK